MTSGEFRERLITLADAATIAVSPGLVESLQAYVDLLAQWNAKINLTSLPLRPPSDETIRRLLLEPLEAAAHVPSGPQNWYDIGSGGGSPAIPLKLARPDLDLCMVEPKTKKVAFLREATRSLGLSRTTVFAERLDDLVSRVALHHSATLVTLRAVKLDGTIVRSIWQLMAERGLFLIFAGAGGPQAPDLSPLFGHQGTILLRGSPSTKLERYVPVFHVEQSC